MAYFTSLNKYKDLGLLIIRVGLGAMFIYHGYPKLMGGKEMWTGLGSSTKYIGITFLPMVWGLLAALAETVGGLLVILGLAFRPACLVLLGTLIVATASHFGKGDSLGDASHAIEDAVVFAGLFFIGPGKYSVDKK